MVGARGKTRMGYVPMLLVFLLIMIFSRLGVTKVTCSHASSFPSPSVFRAVPQEAPDSTALEIAQTHRRPCFQACRISMAWQFVSSIFGHVCLLSSFPVVSSGIQKQTDRRTLRLSARYALQSRREEIFSTRTAMPFPYRHGQFDAN